MLILLIACSAQFGLTDGDRARVDSAEADADTDVDADTDGDSAVDSPADSDSTAPDDPNHSMIAYPWEPYTSQTLMRIKGLQPDFWANMDEVSGNNAGSVSMNLVWAHWEPTRTAAPCAPELIAYEGWCFTPQANLDAAITGWTARGVAVSAIVYGVPEWARTTRVCSPAAPGFEMFCAPDNASDYARFAGMLARRYNGRNGVGLVQDFVIHNEVNSNVWFDTGCGQGITCDTSSWLRIYADNYTQAFDTIRAEQGNAKVFISLEHHFSSADYDQPSLDQPLLGAQTVISAVAAASGSRDWRVAYHPYAPDLLSATFSADDWPKVTYGNLGALLGWLHQTFPGSAAAGDVHLTESGINSLAPSSQSQQATAVCDTFTNVLGTPGISRYIYHRMQDHPDETAAGLGVGLWDSSGVAKTAWSTWALVNRDDTSPPSLSCGFEHLPYVRLTRSNSSSRGHWASTRIAPSGFVAETSYGLLRDQGADTRLLFECAVGDHNMVSMDTGCEGQRAMGPLGWASTIAVSGTSALYRCYIPSTGDHFVSTDPGCEGQTAEHLLGYVWG